MTGISIVILPSPVRASMSALKSPGSHTLMWPSPECIRQLLATFEPFSTRASMLPSPVFKPSESKRPLTFTRPSPVLTSSDPSRFASPLAERQRLEDLLRSSGVDFRTLDDHRRVKVA